MKFYIKITFCIIVGSFLEPKVDTFSLCKRFNSAVVFSIETPSLKFGFNYPVLFLIRYPVTIKRVGII